EEGADAGLGWSNQPGPGAVLQTHTAADFGPDLRSGAANSKSLKYRNGAVRDYVLDHVADGEVSFAVTVTPNPATGALGNWLFRNDEGLYAPHEKIALLFTFNGEPHLVYPSDDSVTRPGLDSVWVQQTITELDMRDVV